MAATHTIAAHTMAARTMVVWCPDWPVVAATRTGAASADEPVAVLRANRVIAASPSARSAGVRRAMRRREAQSRCPDLVTVDDDPGRDARAFEPVAALVDTFTPRIEIVRPGLCQFPTKGPSRYFGGDEALARAITDRLAEGRVEARIGVADGPFAAALAARGSASGSQAGIVAPRTTPAFLAVHAITALVAVEGGRAVTRAARSTRRSSSSEATDADALALVDLVDLLQRLGIRTLGDFAGLAVGDVLARFGPVGERAWRLATGLEARPPVTRVPPPDLLVQAELDPPVERVDTAAFVAKGLAEELHDRLATHGLACTRISIEAETVHGEHLARLWRHERAGAAGGLTPAALADRVRWQLDGWLQSQLQSHLAGDAGDAVAARAERCTGGIVLLRLVPDEVEADTGRQLGLWGGVAAADERAARAFARVQGLLGPDAVTIAVPTGGRRPGDLVTHIPWGDQRVVPPTASQPWPGGLPRPLPSVVHPLPLPAEIFDAAGAVVRVSGRGEPSGAPARLVLSTPGRPAVSSSRVPSSRVPRSPGRSAGNEEEIVGWGGPWLLDERWWDPIAHHRQARLQILTASGRAHVAVLEGGSWWIEASYV